MSACPICPQAMVERAVYITAVPYHSVLRYVFNIVMAGLKGHIGWDSAEDVLILHLTIDKKDAEKHPELIEGTELWAAFKVRGI